MADSLDVYVAVYPGVFCSGEVMGELLSLCYYGFCYGFVSCCFVLLLGLRNMVNRKARSSGFFDRCVEFNPSIASCRLLGRDRGCFYLVLCSMIQAGAWARYALRAYPLSKVACHNPGSRFISASLSPCLHPSLAEGDVAGMITPQGNIYRTFTKAKQADNLTDSAPWSQSAR